MNYLESYNASEGSFAIQDRYGADDMLLMLDTVFSTNSFR